MRKLNFIILIVLMVLLCTSYANAEDTEVVVIDMVSTASPTPVYATPSPAPVITELPDYTYPAEDARCISRAIWSVSPDNPSPETRQSFAEIPQNMVDDGRYKDTIRYTLLMRTEFPSYDPDAYRSDTNNAVADYVMRSWYHAKQTGDRSYRLTPASGIRYSFYERDGVDYITVYDWDWAVVYDSGGFAE